MWSIVLRRWRRPLRGEQEFYIITNLTISNVDFKTSVNILITKWSDMWADWTAEGVADVL
jgi:hypothetical protein